MTKRICMWSGPRNLSTAFMYSFANRDDCVVVDEPFYAYYLKRTGVNHPGREIVLATHPSDFDRILKECVFQEVDRPFLFLKNMPHHMVECQFDFVEQLTHFFLIREPRAMISSFIKKVPDVSMSDLGLQMQWELYSSLIESGHRCPVIDSADLLKNPRAILSLLCDQLGIPFSDRMLSWEAGPISEDGAWAEFWYHSVHKSSGWARQQSTDRNVPELLEPLAQECEKYYQLFKKVALTV